MELLQETISLQNLTFDPGIKWDHQISTEDIRTYLILNILLNSHASGWGPRLISSRNMGPTVTLKTKKYLWLSEFYNL